MMMVQMRWFTRMARRLDHSNQQWYEHPETVLQYRTKTRDVLWQPADPDDLWEDWQDVPTVTDETMVKPPQPA
jgi:hypothetical protein